MTNNPERHWHKHFGPLLRYIVEAKTGRVVPQEVIDDWSILPKSVITGSYEDLLLRSTRLPQNRREHILAGVNSLIRTFDAEQTCTTTAGLSRLKKLEGQLTVRTALQFLPEEIHHHQNYRHLDRTASRLMRVAPSWQTALQEPSLTKIASVVDTSIKGFPWTEIPSMALWGIYWIGKLGKEIRQERV